MRAFSFFCCVFCACVLSDQEREGVLRLLVAKFVDDDVEFLVDAVRLEVLQHSSLLLGGGGFGGGHVGERKERGTDWKHRKAEGTDEGGARSELASSSAEPEIRRRLCSAGHPDRAEVHAHGWSLSDPHLVWAVLPCGGLTFDRTMSEESRPIGLSFRFSGTIDGAACNTAAVFCFIWNNAADRNRCASVIYFDVNRWKAEAIASSRRIIPASPFHHTASFTQLKRHHPTVSAVAQCFRPCCAPTSFVSSHATAVGGSPRVRRDILLATPRQRKLFCSASRRTARRME